MLVHGLVIGECFGVCGYKCDSMSLCFVCVGVRWMCVIGVL